MTGSDFFSYEIGFVLNFFIAQHIRRNLFLREKLEKKDKHAFLDNARSSKHIYISAFLRSVLMRPSPSGRAFLPLPSRPPMIGLSWSIPVDADRR